MIVLCIQFVKAVSLFTKDEAKIKKVTHILFAVVVLSMALNAGMEVFDLIKNSDFMQSSVNSLRTAVGGTKVHALVRTIARLLEPIHRRTNNYKHLSSHFFCGQYLQNRFNMAS